MSSKIYETFLNHFNKRYRLDPTEPLVSYSISGTLFGELSEEDIASTIEGILIKKQENTCYLSYRGTIDGVEFSSENIKVPSTDTLEGIEKFTNLKRLRIVGDFEKDIDLSTYQSVKRVVIENVKSASIILPTSVEELVIENVPTLQDLDVTKLTKLQDCSLYETSIDHLNVRENHELERLAIRRGNIATIDVSQNKKLEVLSLPLCKKITHLDISNNYNLSMLHINGTKIEELDISNNPKLKPKDITFWLSKEEVQRFKIINIANDIEDIPEKPKERMSYAQSMMAKN